MEFRKNSIFIKCAAVMSAVAIIQIIVFLCTSAGSGVLKTVSAGEERIMENYAENGARDLKAAMLKSAGTAEGLAERARQTAEDILKKRGLSADEFYKNSVVTNEYLEAASYSLLEYLRLEPANGAFIIMCGGNGLPDPEKAGEFKGVLFKDTDSGSSKDDYSDLMLLRGDSFIASRYNVPSDINWKKTFSHDPSEKNSMEYFFEPLKAVYSNSGMSANELGYWSGVINLSGESKFDAYSIIAYSMPLMLDGFVYGVVGICISAEEMLSLLPDMKGGPGGGYILSTTEPYAEGYDIEVQAIRGEMLKAAFSVGSSISVKPIRESDCIYSMKNSETGASGKYCTVGIIDIYGEDSPFAGRKWFFLPTNSEEAIFGEYKRVSARLASALVISLVISIVTAIASAKIIFSPIEQLAVEAESARSGDIIPMTETGDGEIYAISKVLNRLSTENSEHLAKMQSERERYMTALRAARSDIFDYTPENDTFTMYRFSTDGMNDEEERSVTEGFRKLVESGRVCPKDDIPAMLRFIDGRSDRDFEIRTFRKDGSVRWNDVNSKSIKNENGDVIRVIASSADITAKKEAELKKLDRERRDSVTGVYNSEYGIILAEKSILERGNAEYTAVSVIVCGAKEYINRYGIYCFNGVLEEIGRTALFCKAENDVLWRTDACTISAYIPERASDKLWDRIEKFLSHVSSVYSSENGDEDCGIRCRVGVSDNKAGTSRKLAFDNSLKAAFAAAAESSAEVEYYKGKETDEKAEKARGMMTSPDVADSRKVYAVTDDVVSYALKMLVKAEDMKKTVEIILRKALRVLKINRAAVYEMNSEKTLVCYCGCNALGKTGSYSFNDVSITDTDFAEGKAAFDLNDALVVGKEYYFRSEKLRAITARFRENGKSVLIPITDKQKFAGFAMFACSDEIYNAELKETLLQLAKILGAYILGSRSSLESREKTDMINRMSDEIRKPLSSIIEAAENTIGMIADENNSDEISAEDALLAIKQSADSLSKIIDSIPVELGGKK